MRNRQMQWLLARAAREDQWRNRWNINDEEYNVWVNDCCWSSLVCMIMGMIMQIEYFGGKSAQCMLWDSANTRKEARMAFLKRYGLSRNPIMADWLTQLR